MLDLHLDSVTLRDILTLVSDKTPEGLSLDFKRTVDIRSEDGKSELVEDIVSFANAAGGDLILGVPEALDSSGKRLGYAGEPVGMSVVNFDEFKLAIENSLRDRIEPRLIGVSYKEFYLNENAVIVIRVPKSYSLHFIRKKSWFKCVARNSAGKYTLDASQVRNQLVLSEALPQRISAFRLERLARIAAKETPVPVLDLAKIVIHLLPWTAFSGGPINISKFTSKSLQYPRGPYTSLVNWTHNIDGHLNWSNDRSEEAIAYLQTFRNGALESVETALGAVGTDNSRHFSSCVDGYLVNGIVRMLGGC